MNKKHFLLGTLLASAVSLFAQTQRHHLPQTLQTRHSVSRSTACLIDSAVESYYNTGWIQEGYSFRFYDSHGNPAQDANPQGGDTTKYTNTYNTDERLTSQATEVFDGSSWITAQKDTYTYDANGHLTSDTEQGADSNNVLVTTYYYMYDSFDLHGNPTVETDIDYTNPPAVDTIHYRYTYTYDLDGHIITSVVQQWDGSSWQNAYQYTYTYDANGNPSTQIEQDWDGSAWQNQYKTEHYYSTNENCSALGIQAINDNMVSVYPNPFTDKLTITNNGSYQLFNLLGQEVYNTALKSDLSVLPAGTYLLKSEFGTAKVVKE